MEIKVIYVNSDCWADTDWDGYEQTEFEKMQDYDKLKEARNNPNMEVYSLQGFEDAFNGEDISDLGFIYFVKE